VKRLDLLLIQPPVHIKRTDLGAMLVSPNMGLAYIASYQRQLGREVAVIDAHALRLGLDEITRQAKELKPAVIGISAMTYQILPAAMVAEALKEAMPNVPIVLGGCHATALPERTLDEFKAFDAVVTGEGEVAIGYLIERFTGGDAAPRPGIYVRGEDFDVPRQPPPMIEDLNSLPFPAFDLFPLRSYHPFYSRRWMMELPLSSSRGCPFKCTFCTKVMGNRPRFRSAENLLAELEYDIAEYDLKQAIFTDENFTLNQSLVGEFCEGIIERQIAGRVRFMCESRVDVADETLQLMAKAGFTHITFGIESGDQEILDKAQKGIRLEQSRRAVEAAKAAGMVVDGNFILGLPYETEETVRRTIDFACSLPLDYASFFLLVPYPGSRVLEMARNGKGYLRLLSDRWEDYGKQTGGAVELTTVSRKRLEQLQFRGYFKFYAHPKRWVKVIKKVSISTVLSYLKMRILSLIRKRS